MSGITMNPMQKRPKDSMILFASDESSITQWTLDNLNIEQSRQSNKENLLALGGLEVLSSKLGVNLNKGLSTQQVMEMRLKFGNNVFPESPMRTFFELFLESFEDLILMILIGASIVSLIVGMIEHPATGWIEGTAILMAVFIVAIVTAGNNYTKELQFRALEKSSQIDERCSVLRNGGVERVNPADLVVGDILVLQAGDAIPADSIIADASVVRSNESALTGEAEDIRKSLDDDCFLLSSCLLTEAEDKVHAMVIGIGCFSQWGKIKANLVSEDENTPLQEKLEDMAGLIGYIGMAAALGTFSAMVASIWLRYNGHGVLDRLVEAFIIAVTIIVVAIPEGLPLAVTISLAYSTKKMYEDQCFIRVLAACETMGNATNLCSDKTGTLTENRMTVVEAWMGDVYYNQKDFITCGATEAVKHTIAQNVCINRVAYLVYKDSNGNILSRPNIIGNKTEGALILMAQAWGFNYEKMKESSFSLERNDKIFSFHSLKKRSTAVIHRPDGSVRLLVKGAPEWLLADCTMYLTKDGSVAPLNAAKKRDIETHINAMANNARRTLCIAHKDFASAKMLPVNWMDSPPDNSGLCCDCIVGIIDPLRGDVVDAVSTAQRAGVTVRMVTGDNLNTACAIARQCGILSPNGLALEGPVFRAMTPAQVDGAIPRLQVLARSSPDDKFLLVCRLNGHSIPDGEEEWLEKHKDKPGVSWHADKDRLLPGYMEEWEVGRPEGGHVVGVTGDGTNDAPALKAADVGLAMGITGTKVAQSASDIVILDDKFSSIVRAIMWGRSVYDNIRKFLQFQLTVNVVALIIVFIGAVAGFDPPLNAVMMLWVNLIMDTMGALALGTEPPSLDLLERRPYKRTASLISKPMWRNILFQSGFQLILLLSLLFKGADFFNVPNGDNCEYYQMSYSDDNYENGVYRWNPVTGGLVKDGSDPDATVSCISFDMLCGPDYLGDCFDVDHQVYVGDDGESVQYNFNDLEGFKDHCVECIEHSYVHTTIIFNSFVFCQLFNEFNARSIFDDWNVFSGLHKNPIFSLVIVATTVLQFFIVTFGGEFTRTSPLTTDQWIWTVCFGLLTFPMGVVMRFFPVKESEESFFDSGGLSSEITAKAIMRHSVDMSKHSTKTSWWDNLGGSQRGKHIPLPQESQHNI